MGQVTQFHRYERTDLDMRVIEELEVSLGRARSREVLGDVCIEMIDKAARIDRSLERGDFTSAAKLARNISSLAGQIGMKDYSVAARNLSNCLEGTDHVAITAVLGRFERISESSLYSVLELANVPDL